MSKSTEELLAALESCRSFTDYYSENAEDLSVSSLAEQLSALIAKKGLKRTHVIRDAQISDIYGYQIFTGVKKNPMREKLLCILIAMQADLKETQSLLKKNGYPPLYPKNPADCVIIYGICRKMSVTEINAMLYDYGLAMI